MPQVLLRSGRLAVYQPVCQRKHTEVESIQLLFSKIATKLISSSDSSTDSPRKIIQLQEVNSLAGHLVLGDEPLLILSTNHSIPRFFEMDGSVYSACDCSLNDENGLIVLDAAVSLTILVSYHAKKAEIQNNPVLFSYPPLLDFSLQLPHEPLIGGRYFHDIVYDSDRRIYAASSSQYQKFAMYDGDGNIMWKPPPNLLKASASENLRSSLELISPRDWDVIDG